MWYKLRPVPTWTDIKDHARSSYKLADEQDHSFKVVFAYPDNRLQAVIVSHYRAMDRSWVDFSSACCRADRMDPEAALQQSFNLAVGSLCLDGDVYVVRHTAMVDHIHLTDLELSMHAVARAADQIEQALPLYEPASDTLPDVDEVEQERA
ncbi:MAG: hypothetical protein KJO40_15715 [Deltaproteobacteria bacterium]|nr:hypothetical protein [Deltaproteobacteria bacterium]NNK06895.1 hypothetical protein [Myxococcales bacterium]NNK43235.1 hypothetical protein [Myxococcales bacterium]